MGIEQRDAEFTGFIRARRLAYVRTAFLLCGDWHRAEDLVQDAMVKLYVAWPRVYHQGTEEAYVRRILVNTHLDNWRWRRRRPETTLDECNQRDEPDEGPAAIAERIALRQALTGLPEGQRKVVVLRFWLDQSVEETAADLRISTGTVKSQSARGLARLRNLLGVAGSEGYEHTNRRIAP